MKLVGIRDDLHTHIGRLFDDDAVVPLAEASVERRRSRPWTLGRNADWSGPFSPVVGAVAKPVVAEVT